MDPMTMRATAVSLGLVLALGVAASAAAFTGQGERRTGASGGEVRLALREGRLGVGHLPQRRRTGPREPRPTHGILPMTRRSQEAPRAAAPRDTARRQAAPGHGILPQGGASTRQGIDPRFLPATIAYSTRHAPGTIVVDTEEKYLYHVLPGGKARRYGVGVGRPGFQWAGTHRVSMKREWPGWTPPAAMRRRQPELPAFMPGGPDNPLGARALYLGSTLYRIHGSNAPWTIGHAVSSGCIRMRNEDVIDLYEKVKVGSKVVVMR